MSVLIPAQGIPQSGWTQLPGATYISATSFSVPGDVTDRITTGTKLWLVNSGNKFVYAISAVFSAGATTITTFGGSAYSLVAGITAAYYSNNKVAKNFPGRHLWAPTVGGFGTAPADAFYEFWLDGVECSVWATQPTGTASGGTTLTISAPIVAKTQTNGHWGNRLFLANNNTTLIDTAIIRILSGGSTFECFTNGNFAAWSAAGNKQIIGGMRYPIA